MRRSARLLEQVARVETVHRYTSRMAKVDRDLWTLDPDIDFLNHGSFGAAPLRVLDAQSTMRARLESEPV